tara:strand:+ start:2026 stop:2217 length:192 start_codon:yes stop_codon:yes gene_type:complete
MNGLASNIELFQEKSTPAGIAGTDRGETGLPLQRALRLDFIAGTVYVVPLKIFQPNRNDYDDT